VKVKPLTRAELLALPPATDLPTLGRAFGISEPVARERHRRKEWAAMGIRVFRLGQQWRVVTADIWRALGVDLDLMPEPVTDPSPRRDMVAAGAVLPAPAAHATALKPLAEDITNAHRTSNRRE
jgi:hypothetical protein